MRTRPTATPPSLPTYADAAIPFPALSPLPRYTSPRWTCVAPTHAVLLSSRRRRRSTLRVPARALALTPTLALHPTLTTTLTTTLKHIPTLSTTLKRTPTLTSSGVRACAACMSRAPDRVHQLRDVGLHGCAHVARRQTLPDDKVTRPRPRLVRTSSHPQSHASTHRLRQVPPAAL